MESGDVAASAVGICSCLDPLPMDPQQSQGGNRVDRYRGYALMPAPTRFLLGGLLMLAAMGIAIIVYGVGH